MKTPEERKQQFIEEHQEEWAKAGLNFRKLRNLARVSLNQLSVMTGFSPSKLGAFERGFPVHNRKVIQRLYPLCLKQKLTETRAAIEDVHEQLNLSHY